MDETPACKPEDVRQLAERTKDNQQPIGLGADYTFLAGRHWRSLVMLMFHTGMMGIVVVTGDRENDVKSVASVLNEIGVGGLNIEVVLG